MLERLLSHSVRSRCAIKCWDTYPGDAETKHCDVEVSIKNIVDACVYVSMDLKDHCYAWLARGMCTAIVESIINEIAALLSKGVLIELRTCSSEVEWDDVKGQRSSEGWGVWVDH